MKLYPRSRLRNMLSSGVNPYNRDLYATNGFLMPVTNANASVKWVEDKDGVLVQSPANTPAMPGCRLATTVATGALLGPELNANKNFLAWVGDDPTGYTVSGENAANYITEHVDGCKIVSDGSSALFLRLSITGVVGEKYYFSLTKCNHVSGVLRVATTGADFALQNITGSDADGTYNFTATCTATTILLDIYRVPLSTTNYVLSEISVKKVIPTWLPTASDGTLISPISRMLRTAQGSVAEYDETYPGLLVEPARTNYLLATATPATQTTGSLAAGTYTLWIEGAGSAAVTAGTATISGNGTASAGSPNTFTVSVAGTVTVTVTDPVTFFQLEGGAFPTSKIPTTTAAVTRAADNVSFATPSWLLAHPNDFAVIGTVIPKQVPTASNYFFSLYVSGTDYTAIYQNVGTNNVVRMIVKVANTNKAVLAATTTIMIGLPLQYIAVKSSILGCFIAARTFDGTDWSAWSAWTAITTNDAKADITAPVACNVGAFTGASGHFYATYPMTRILRIPTNLSVAALQAWLIAKAGA